MRFSNRLTLALVALALPSLLAGAAPAAYAEPQPGAADSAPRAATAAPALALPFIDDDYARALAEARKLNRPIFIEAWATWCHTCRSMRAYVFTDESLARQAERFVWLSMDGENPKNAALRERLALVGYPSYFVLDPRDERVAFRWVGSFSVAQFPKLLDAAEVAVNGARTPLDRALVRADSLYATGRDSAAAAQYGAVLDAAPRDYPFRARATESALFALSQSEQPEACARLASGSLPTLGRSALAATVAGSGLDCALQLPAANAARTGWIADFERALRDMVADTSIVMAGDDRSGLYGILISAREDAGDSLGARRTTEAWARQLEGAAAKARSPEQRAVYDSHRLSAYLELGEPARAIPMLEQSQRDFPTDYNPPARLAVAYNAMKRWADALAASDRALALAYGPRTLNIYRTRTDILMGRGDTPAAKQSLRDAIAFANTLPSAQRSPTAIAALQKRLDGMP